MNALQHITGAVVIDSTVQVQAEVTVQRICVITEPVLQAADTDQLLINLVILTGKGKPAHLDIAVRQRINASRHSFLVKRPAQSPAADDVPVLDPSAGLDPDEFLLFRDGKLELFTDHRSPFQNIPA